LPTVALVLVIVFCLPTKVGLVGGLDTVFGAVQTEQKGLYCPVAGSRACGWNLHFYMDVDERGLWIIFSTHSMSRTYSA
jgi:hypothetical protein